MLRVRTINDLKKKDKRQNRRKINKEMLNGKGIRQEGSERNNYRKGKLFCLFLKNKI